MIWHTVSRHMDEAIPLDHPRRFASRVIRWYGLTHSRWYSMPEQVTIIIMCICYLKGLGDNRGQLSLEPPLSPEYKNSSPPAAAAIPRSFWLLLGPQPWLPPHLLGLYEFLSQPPAGPASHTSCTWITETLLQLSVISVLFLLCFVRICLLMPCGHLLGKGWPLGSRLWCLIVKLSLSNWYPGSGVVLDCIDSWSLPFFLLFLESLAFFLKRLTAN